MQYRSAGVGSSSGVGAGGPGVLCVLPAYYQTTGAEAKQINADNIRHTKRFTAPIDFEFTDFNVYVAAVGTQGNITADLYVTDSDGEPTGSSLATKTLDCGSGAGWLNVEWTTAYQCGYGIQYIVVIKRVASSSTDVSLSARRWNTTQGSMFPDGCASIESADGGSTWTATTQTETNAKPALLNLIINPQADGVPSLWYGRTNDRYLTLANGAKVLIPEAGYELDCSALTADTLYYIYAYNSSGFAMEASTTGIARSNGQWVKSGDASKLLIGVIVPKDALGGGDQCPVDVMDMRLVVYPGMRKLFGKLNPYSANTTEAFVGATDWRAVMNNTDWKIEGIVSSMRISFRTIWQSDGEKYVSIGANATTSNSKYPGSIVWDNYNHVTACYNENDNIIPKYSYFVPVNKTAGAYTIEHLFISGTSSRGSSLEGELWW